MDKFGIFKLLNSFFNFYKQSASQPGEQSPNEKTSVADFISSFLNNANATQKTSNEKETGQANSSYLRAPLQTQMLGTMTSHDQFIKRVKEKQKQN